MPFISVDIEATGPIPGLYDMVSFGAVRLVNNNGLYEISKDELYIEIRPEVGGVDPEAMRVNRLDLELLSLHGLPIREAAILITEWVAAGATIDDPAIFVGYTANFDWAFVNDMFFRCGLANPFGYQAFDLRPLAMGLLKMPWRALKQDQILPRLGLEPQSQELIHNALQDAKHQALILCRLLALTGMTEALKF